MPKFSIIIPAHNAADRIGAALSSIRTQSFTDYELIVVCDSCEDNTAQIAWAYDARTETVDFHSTGLTRNRGIDLATGEWILFMDDDDWLLHEFALEELNKHLRGDIVLFGFIFKGVGYAHPRMANGYPWPAVWCKGWKRSAIGDTHFPDTFPEDVPFTAEMMSKGLDVVEFDQPLYYYNYMRHGSISETMAAKGIVKDLRR